MRLASWIHAFFLLLLASGCDSSPEDAPLKLPPREDLAWVARLNKGGRQCDPYERFIPPDSKALLAEQGVPVYDTRIEVLGACEACSCAEYTALHYALVPKARLAEAKQAGFDPRDPPPVP